MFMIDERGRLQELQRAEFSSEDLFQDLLARFPAVLRSAAGGSDRLLLVRREAPVPEAAGGSGRWSLDHLFLDAAGVPVLVEVKRASDTRVRREVVAQMLDYAANGVAYWPTEEIVAAFRATASQDGGNPDAALAAFLENAEPEAFWRQVDANLRSGRIRMVFVADAIPKELRRIVEFLNEQMRPAEVLAVEVEHFTTADGVRLLSPRVIGATERASSAKAIQAPQTLVDEEGWFLELGRVHGASSEAQARRLSAWLRDHNLRLSVASSQDALAASLPKEGGRQSWPFFLRRSSGKVEVSLQYLKNTPAYADDSAREQLLSDMQALPGVQVSTVKLTGWPAVPLAALENEDLWNSLTLLYARVIAKLRDS